MSDIMRPIPIGTLFDWIHDEYKQSQNIFGVRKQYRANPDKTIPLFNEKMEIPLGPAAGPHTQLAQNIIASYVGGARFFELKTCQVIDGEDLPVAKPCITAVDECYNCEWSTELRIPQAYEEYVKAWFVLKILCKELELGDPDHFIFNMSVGYDLAGIQTEKINNYIEGMKDASNQPIWHACQEAALARLDQFKKVDKAYIENISPIISQSTTLSTLHGCPPDEIERIASYLITEKNVHTFVKCNPTMLGYEFARKTCDELGYDYIVFDDHHFKEDLQFEDAVPMFHRLQALADSKNLSFGVKLTNTFPVAVAADELPSDEMYMSGRSLFPLSIELAKRLSEAFDGKLRISFSGGIDLFNVAELFACNIWPITVATTLLKPGGYQRFTQLAETLARCDYQPFTSVDRNKLDALVQKSRSDAHYIKPIKPLPVRKVTEKVPLSNCFMAPCRNGCPINQDIPAYLRLVDEGKHLEALRVIVDKNPLPFITGTICNHRCMDKCTRSFYEESVHIRNVKLEAAEAAYDQYLSELTVPAISGAEKVAVVGGGPGGIAMAHLLAREGVSVTVFEKREQLGGVPRHVVPEFRIPAQSIENDAEMARKLGAQFITGKEAPSLEELRAQGFTRVVYATGAWNPGRLPMESGEAVNAYVFLSHCRANPTTEEYGKRVVVIGGGNTAMDCARAAAHLPSVTEASLVYRRDRRNMPADEEELVMALEDNVVFRELLSPVRYENGLLHCEVMKLGAPDASGRRSPVTTGETVDIPCDTVVAAVGEKIDYALFEQNGIAIDEKGRVATNAQTLETNQPNVYVIGDCNRGPATIVEAIADATKVAKAIANTQNDHYEALNINADPEHARDKHGKLVVDNASCNIAGRCLECSTVCESCVDACPNRANVSIRIADGSAQILHIDGMCNECGNCETFCPYSSAPYRDKFTVFGTLEDYASSKNDGFVIENATNESYNVRLTGNDYRVTKENMSAIPADIAAMIAAVIENYPHYLYA